MIADLLKIRRSTMCYTLKVRCPFCSAIHTHGGGDPYGEILFGQRSAHCGGGDYDIVKKDLPIEDLIKPVVKVNAVSPYSERR
jgi:hypothetical protein